MAALTAIKGKPDSTFRVKSSFSPCFLLPSNRLASLAASKKWERSSLAERADACIKGRKVKLALQLHKNRCLHWVTIVLLKSPDFCMASSGLGRRRPQLRCPAHHHSLNLPFSICEKRIIISVLCTLQGLLWGSNEIMYVKRFVNCKMLYKCKGL